MNEFEIIKDENIKKLDMIIIPLSIYFYNQKAIRVLGPSMTRTMLNWSELLDKYRGKSIKKDYKLKKWSEIGNLVPNKKSKIEITQPRNETSIQDNYKPIGTAEESIDLGISRIKTSDEHVLIRTKIRNPNLNQVSPSDLNYKIQLPDKKLTVEELFYDTLMQDSETIPALYNTSQETITEKISDRDSILQDMLEMNRKFNQDL